MSQVSGTNGIENEEFLEEELHENEDIESNEIHQKRINPWEACMSNISTMERFNFAPSNPISKVNSFLIMYFDYQNFNSNYCRLNKMNARD